MNTDESPAPVKDGLIAVVKRECPTCTLVAPVLERLAASGALIVCQDDPAFPPGVSGVVDDTSLSVSFRLGIDFVPTLVRIAGGCEAGRVFGWNRTEWRAFTGIADLGADLPENRPGCGSMTTDPGMAARLAVRFGRTGLKSRRIPIPAQVDPIEFCHERGAKVKVISKARPRGDFVGQGDIYDGLIVKTISPKEVTFSLIQDGQEYTLTLPRE